MADQAQADERRSTSDGEMMAFLARHGIEISMKAQRRRVTALGRQASSGRRWLVVLDGDGATVEAAIRGVLAGLLGAAAVPL